MASSSVKSLHATCASLHCLMRASGSCASGFDDDGSYVPMPSTSSVMALTTFASAVLVLQRVLFFVVALFVALAQRVLVIVLGEDRVKLQVTIDAVTGYV